MPIVKTDKKLKIIECLKQQIPTFIDRDFLLLTSDSNQIFRGNGNEIPVSEYSNTIIINSDSFNVDNPINGKMYVFIGADVVTIRTYANDKWLNVLSSTGYVTIDSIADFSNKTIDLSALYNNKIKNADMTIFNTGKIQLGSGETVSQAKIPSVDYVNQKISWIETS